MDKKEVTNENLFLMIEDLALIVKKGFDGVDKKFDGVDKKFDIVDKRLRALEQGQDEIKMKLDNKADTFEVVELEEKVKVLENNSIA